MPDTKPETERKRGGRYVPRFLNREQVGTVEEQDPDLDAAPPEPADPEVEAAAEPEPEPEKPPVKPRAKAKKPDFSDLTKDPRRLQLWNRRLLNPHGSSSAPIRLKDEYAGMHVRWINTKIEGRYHRAVYEQGWQPVPAEALADPKEIHGLQILDGKVCRGDHGAEVLMWIPERVFKSVQRRKAELIHESYQAGNIQNTLMAGGTEKLGEQTAGTVASFHGSITAGTERIVIGDED